MERRQRLSTGELDRALETPGWLLWTLDCYAVMKREGELMSAPAEGAYSKRLEARFDSIGWGLLFLLFAALALPNGTAEYASAAVVGGLLIGLNVARLAYGVPIRWFSVVLGASMTIAGGGALAGARLDVFVVFFALAGVVTIAMALIRKERLQTA
jgi:hypothetical protein